MPEEKGKLEPGSAEVKKIAQEAMQRHHDYYVGLGRKGELTQPDRHQLELTKQREAEGLVKPLVEEDSSGGPAPSSENQ